MTNEAYEFIKDVQEKKKTATGAYHKATSTVRWNTTLQQEERKAMKEATTISVDPNVFISYSEFRSLPNTLQKYYLEAINGRYEMGVRPLSAAWHVSWNRVKKLFDVYGIKTKRKRNTNANVIAWKRFTGQLVDDGNNSESEKKEIINSCVAGGCSIEGVVQVIPEPGFKQGVIVQKLDNPKPLCAIDGAKFAFTAYDKDKICAVLDAVAGDGEYKVIVELIRA